MEPSDHEAGLSGQSFRRYLTTRLVVLLASALAIAGGTLLTLSAFDRRHDSLDRLRLASIAAGRSIENYIGEHRRAVRMLAESLHEVDDPADLGERLGEVRKTAPGFSTMIVTDATGRVIAASPVTSEEGVSVLGADVSDRSYFRVAMYEERDFVSHVFEGRGYGVTPIVAISAPVRGPDGRPRGVVEGSLDLGLFRRFEEDLALTDHSVIVIADQKARIVYASALTGLEPLRLLPGGSLERLSFERSFLDSEGKRHLVVSRRLGNGWYLFASKPRSALYWSLVRELFIGVMLLLMFVTVALIAGQWLAGRMTRPIERLAIAARRIGSDDFAPDAFRIESAPREVAELGDDLMLMTEALRESNQRLQRTLRNEERLRRQLEEEREQLENEMVRREDARRELEILNRQLEIARDLALEGSRTKSAFLANMSHELRTPLNSILGFSDILSQRLEAMGEERLARSANNIETSGRELLQLIDQLLQIARAESEDALLVVPSDVSLLIESAASIARRSALQGKSIEVISETSVGMVRTDPEKLQQAILNLLLAAQRRFPGDTIRVSAVRTDIEGRSHLAMAIDDGSATPPITAEAVAALTSRGARLESALASNEVEVRSSLTIAEKYCHLLGGQLLVDEKKPQYVIIVPTETSRPDGGIDSSVS